MHRLFFLFLIAAGLSASAADAPYAVKNIKPELLKNANVVKRMEEIRFEIYSTTHTVMNYKYAFTVLNENGEHMANFTEWYDKLRQINSIEGKLYDASGKQIKSLKAKDIKDLSGVDNISLMDDNRYKQHNFFHKVYPYTVEYEVEVKYNNTFYFPSWITQEDENLSVESTSYSLTCPADYQFRYKQLNYKGEPQQTTAKNKKTYTWSLANVPAIKKEFASPRWQEITTMLSVAPTHFELEGYKGNMSTWKEFGLFLYNLQKDRYTLPAAIKQKVKEMTAGLSDKEKIKLLYNFMQQNTRYISIQLGLGGWQPFPAEYVAQKGYGDCKALSNYMYSLLKEVNIKSYYTLIKAGSQDHYMMEDFPSNQFNHAILCVPMANDTLWLECTSQTAPAGYMGDFTGNRKALLVDENGGVLVNTPSYGLKDNKQLRTIKGTIDAEGNLKVKASTQYAAIQQDYYHDLINHYSKDKIKEALQENLQFATYHVNDFKYTERKNEQPTITEDLDIDVSGFATITGKRMFIMPNLLNRSTWKPSNEDKRVTDICFYYAYTDVDTVMIEIPEGYAPESLPAPVSIKSKFGTYKSEIKIVDRQLMYTRVNEKFAGRFPASDYAEMVTYFNSINKADFAQAVLKKKD